jgi:hypothetical protein
VNTTDYFVESVENEKLVELVKAGDKDAYETIVQKYRDIDNFDMTHIEMSAPTDSEIKDIARVSGVDRSILEAILHGEEVKNTDKNFKAIQFVSSTTQDKLGVILTNSVTLISLSQNENTADNILMQGAKSIYNLLNLEGYMNLDLADVFSVINVGDRYAHIGTGHGKGKEKGENAVKEVFSSSVFEKVVAKSIGIIVNITLSRDICLETISEIMGSISKKISPDANLIFGTSFGDNLNDEVKLTIIAMDSEKPVYEISP